MPGDRARPRSSPRRRVAFAPGGNTEELVGAVAALAVDTTVRFVLVGGLAVSARLQVAHRVTRDIDTVVADTDRAALLAPAARPNPDAPRNIGGVPLDVIEVDPTTTFDEVAAVDDPADRLFVAAHLYAYTDADELTITCGTTTATVLVATTPALFVAKLGAYHGRRRNPVKHGSDGLDVYRLGRLLAASDGGLRPSERVVAAAAAWGLRRIAENPQDMLRRLTLVGVNDVTGGQVTSLVDVLLDDLGRDD